MGEIAAPDHAAPQVIALDRWTKERQNLRIAEWLEGIASHLRRRETVVMPDRVLLVLQSGNAAHGVDDYECLHLGLTRTMARRTCDTLEERARLRSTRGEEHDDGE